VDYETQSNGSFWGGVVKGIIAVMCVLSASVYGFDSKEKNKQAQYEVYCSKANELRRYWLSDDVKTNYAILVGSHWIWVQDFYDALAKQVPSEYAALMGNLADLELHCETMIPPSLHEHRKICVNMIQFFLKSYWDDLSVASHEERKDFK